MEHRMNLPAAWHHKNFTYQQLAHCGAELLTGFCLDTSHMARQILCIACQINKLTLIKDANFLVSQENIQKYYDYLMRFKNQEPLSRIEGVKNFYNFDFEISPFTLDPRPETEILIDLAIKNYPNHDDYLNIIDIGTGTGCLAVTIARIYPNSRITALDICENTLIIANRNAEKAGVQSRIDFKIINENPNEINIALYDIILCNPPYIPETARDYLDASVKDFDPAIALFFGDDGLGFYHILAEFSLKNLKENGIVLVEFGIGQAKCVKEIFADKMLKDFCATKDNNDIIRVAKIKF
jgi:release factor glutamine methyltransferase